MSATTCQPQSKLIEDMKKEDFLKITKDEFNSYPRFYQRLIAGYFGLKAEKRLRDEKDEARTIRCRRKTLGYEGEVQEDYYWSDSRDLFDEILKSLHNPS